MHRSVSWSSTAAALQLHWICSCELQAAEPIIDFAQRTGRPFAMVPCCVYPMEFPRRRLLDGTWVRRYEQLIDYLQSRDPHHVKVATLPFEGRNQVVYCTSWRD